MADQMFGHSVEAKPMGVGMCSGYGNPQVAWVLAINPVQAQCQQASQKKTVLCSARHAASRTNKRLNLGCP